MDYISEPENAITRFVTRDGATVDQIRDSFCDVQRFAPTEQKVLAGLAVLQELGKVRRSGGRIFWCEMDES